MNQNATTPNNNDNGIVKFVIVNRRPGGKSNTTPQQSLLKKRKACDSPNKPGRAAKKPKTTNQPPVAITRGPSTSTLVGAQISLISKDGSLQTAYLNSNVSDVEPEPKVQLPMPCKIARTAILSTGYTVSKQGYDDKLFDRHRKWLTVYPKENTTYTKKKPEPITLYTDNPDGTFTVPRSYGLARWGAPGSDQTTLGEAMHCTFTGTLRPEQQPVFDDVMEQFRNPEKTNSGILSLPCGFGKTVLALAIACALGRKTLITVNSDVLMKQSIKRIKQYVPDARVGILQSDKMQIEDVDIVVAMIHSVVRRDYPDWIWEHFGLWIGDEVHHVAAPGFSYIRNKVKCRYTLGMSATVRRNDGLVRVLHWLVGPIIIDIKRAWQLVLCHMVTCQGGLQQELKYKDGRLKRADMTRIKTREYGRNSKIVEDIIEAFLNPAPLNRQRNIMVFSERREHLTTLHDMILQQLLDVYKCLTLNADCCFVDDSIKNKTRILYQIGNEKEEATTLFSIGYVVGGISKKEQKIAETCDVIMLTYQMAQEGLDFPRADTAFLTTDRSDVEQTVGRILRKHDEKNVPMIYYYVNPFSCFLGQSFQVSKYFKNLGYQMHYQEYVY